MMSLCKALRLSRLLAALGALSLLLLTGCASLGLAYHTRNRCYWCREIVSAYWRQDELSVAFRAEGRGQEIFVVSFTSQRLREGGPGRPLYLGVLANRECKPDGPVKTCGKWLLRFLTWAWAEDPPGTIPKGAQPVPVVHLEPHTRALPPLPAGTPMQICIWPCGGAESLQPYEEQFFFVRADKGAVMQREVILTAHSGTPWWYWPLLPVTLGFDIATLPIQVLVALVVENTVGEEGILNSRRIREPGAKE